MGLLFRGSELCYCPVLTIHVYTFQVIRVTCITTATGLSTACDTVFSQVSSLIYKKNINMKTASLLKKTVICRHYVNIPITYIVYQ